MHLSKSKYCQLWQCPKMAWLTKYKPELQEISEDVQARFVAGNQVGDLAMELFGDFTEVTTYDAEGKLDLVVDAAVLELKKFEALVAMSNGKASKIIIPTDAVEMTKSNVIFSETSGIGDTTKPAPETKKPKPADPCCD